MFVISNCRLEEDHKSCAGEGGGGDSAHKHDWEGSGHWAKLQLGKRCIARIGDDETMMSPSMMMIIDESLMKMMMTLSTPHTPPSQTETVVAIPRRCYGYSRHPHGPPLSERYDSRSLVHGLMMQPARGLPPCAAAADAAARHKPNGSVP